MSERLKLAEELLKERGVVDIKFTVNPTNWDRLPASEFKESLAETLFMYLDGRCLEKKVENEQTRIN